jgi:hypothetical protein
VANGIKAFTLEGQLAAIGDRYPARAGELLGRGPLCRGANPLKRHVYQGHITAGHATQVEPRPAGSGADVEQSPAGTQLQQRAQSICFGSRRPAGASVITSAEGTLDFKHDGRLAKAIPLGKMLGQIPFTGGATHPQSLLRPRAANRPLL